MRGRLARISRRWADRGLGLKTLVRPGDQSDDPEAASRRRRFMTLLIDREGRLLEIDRIVTGHDLEVARLHHPLHLGVPITQRLGVDGEGHGAHLTRLQRDSLEATQFLDRTGGRTDQLVNIELHHLVARAALDKLQATPPAARREAQEDSPLEQLFVRDGPRCWFMPLREVSVFSAEGNYVRMQWGQERPLLGRSLATLESKLDPRRFFFARTDSRSSIWN